MAPNAVEKALQVLLAFQEERPSWGVRELSAHLGFSPATVQRLLQTLKKYGFIEQDADSRQYRLGSVYFQFVGVLQSTSPLSRLAAPLMERLASATGETAHLNRAEGEHRICVGSVESLQNLKAGMPVGNRSPLHAGASSKCLLAYSSSAFRHDYLSTMALEAMTDRTICDPDALRMEIATIRRQGFAASLGERTPGLGSLSVPVFDHGGLLLAALSLAVPELRFGDASHRDRCLRLLLEAGGELSRGMGHQGRYPLVLDDPEAED